MVGWPVISGPVAGSTSWRVFVRYNRLLPSWQPVSKIESKGKGQDTNTFFNSMSQ